MKRRLRQKHGQQPARRLAELTWRHRPGLEGGQAPTQRQRSSKHSERGARRAGDKVPRPVGGLAPRCVCPGGEASGWAAGCPAARGGAPSQPRTPHCGSSGGARWSSEGRRSFRSQEEHVG